MNGLHSSSFMQDRFPKLYEIHTERGADMIDVNGLQMPLQYHQGMVTEHHHCRTKACLFDISNHVTQVLLIGQNLTEKLEALIPSAIKELKPGKIRYSVLTNDHGGIRDDILLCNAEDHFYMRLNASMSPQNIAYIKAHLSDVEVIDLSDQALLNIQGPLSEQIVSKLTPSAQNLKFMETCETSVLDATCRISRSGYTGEDGFEISIPKEQAHDLVNTLLSEATLELAGMGARESLRIEAGFNAYGKDMDARTSPVEAQIAWVIQKRRIQEANFIGAKRILSEIKQGPIRKLVGIMPEGFKTVQIGSEILSLEDKKIGTITSSTFSPTIGAPIANGYVLSDYAAIGTDVRLIIDETPTQARISKRPIVPHRYKR